MRHILIIALGILTSLISCSKRTFPDGSLKPRVVRKWYKDKIPYEYRTINTVVPYFLDEDSLKHYKSIGVSFCSQLETSFTKVQDFYEKQFSFKKDLEPLEKKALFCGLDTCLLKNINSNCQFTLYYLSRSTETINYQKAKPLERLLLKSDTFYAERNYVIALRLQIDLNIGKDIQSGIPTCDVNFSTTFYIKKSGDADKTDWNEISSRDTNEENYKTFISAYNIELSNSCDMQTTKFKILKKK